MVLGLSAPVFPEFHLVEHLPGIGDFAAVVADRTGKVVLIVDMQSDVCARAR